MQKLLALIIAGAFAAVAPTTFAQDKKGPSAEKKDDKGAKKDEKATKK